MITKGGRLDVIAAIDDPRIVAKILSHLGLTCTMPELAPARAPPQGDFDFDQTLE